MEDFAKAHVQIFLALSELPAHGRMAVEGVIGSISPQTIEGILNLPRRKWPGRARRAKTAATIWDHLRLDSSQQRHIPGFGPNPGMVRAADDSAIQIAPVPKSSPSAERAFASQ